MDIEALAKKAGMITELQSGAASCVWTAGLTAVSADQLIAFAALVAAAEREACANVCHSIAFDMRIHPLASRGAFDCKKAIMARSNAALTGAEGVRV